jgi:hypothetical protein
LFFFPSANIDMKMASKYIWQFKLSEFNITPYSLSFSPFQCFLSLFLILLALTFILFSGLCLSLSPSICLCLSFSLNAQMTLCLADSCEGVPWERVHYFTTLTSTEKIVRFSYLNDCQSFWSSFLESKIQFLKITTF